MARRSRIGSVALISALPGLATVACELALPTVASEAALPDASEAASDSAPSAQDAPISDASVCMHVEPPAETGVGDPGATTFVVAFENLFFDPATPVMCNDSGASVMLGFDLDHTCSCEGPGASCGAPSAACDRPGGRDVSGNLALLSNPLLENELATNLQAGHLGALIEVSGYNGQSDDRGVVAGLILTSGIAGDAAPRWDGTDSWFYDPGSYLDGSPLASQLGYVTARTLVVHVTPATINLGFATLTLDDAVVVATIEPDFARGGYDLVGQLAGRLALKNALEVLASFKVGNQYLCGPAGASYRALICGAADIASNPASDGTAAPCDALSIAIGFCATPARVGPRGTPFKRTIGCDGDIGSCGD